MELRISGADTTSRRYLKPELVQMSRDRHIATKITNQVIIAGWLNKPKGALKFLYERGYINNELVTKPSKMRYSKHGKKSDSDPDTGKLKQDCEAYSLTKLLSKCSDLIEQMYEEITSRNDYSANILFIPKYHCELASKGIEYSCGASKRIHRKEPLHKKR